MLQRKYCNPQKSAILLGALVAAGAFSIGLPAQALHAVSAGAPLRTITTARQAHDLSSVEAKRAYPIHLRGVVTYFDTDTGTGNGALYIHDASGNIFVKIPGGVIKSLPIGSLVDVQGVSNLGGFAPVVDRAHVKLIGKSKLPSYAPPVSRTVLFSGGYEGQWIQVGGVVRSVADSGHSVTVELAMMDGILFATSLREEGADYSSLVDATVSIKGNEAPLYNNVGQMIGARVIFPNLSAVRIITPAPRNPFQSPIASIDSLLRWDQVASGHHRVHLRGRVTMQWPGSTLCIRDATDAVCAQISQNERIDIGDVADVVGFVGAENSTTVITNGVFQKMGNGSPVQGYNTTAEQAMMGKLDSELIQIDGRLIGRDFSSSDTTLLLSSGNFIFTAALPKALATPRADTWQTGSILRITGICSVQFDPKLSVRKDGAAVPKSFRVLMRSPADVVVIHQASWFTPPHMSLVLALALCLTLAVLIWVIVLRRRVQQQASLLRDSEERFRHMALHDSLTGLATRLLLQDRLGVAFESARRHHSGLAVMMVDVDHFKEINDNFGHQFGDEVLKTTADRLLHAVRREDTVARIGGDEFVVLLSDIAAPEDAERIAAAIVESLALPISASGIQVPVSVSVGLCASADAELEPEALLKNADAALYAAKERGRNCFERFTPEAPCEFSI
jgi:diguanylate cyclase (GGDEF)-like protein